MRVAQRIFVGCFYILIASAASSFAQQPPPQSRACEGWQSDPKGELRPGQSGILASSGMFDYSHRQYPFEALSLWGKHPTDPEKICIRYTIKNMDSEKIESVVWADAGMYFLDIDSKKWAEWIRQPSPPYPPVSAQSDVKAFQNSVQTVSALLQSSPKHVGSAGPIYQWSQEASLGYATFDVAKSMPEVVPVLMRAGISAQSVTALGVKADIKKRLELATEFSGEDYSFVHFSSVVPEGNEYIFEEGMKFKDMKNELQVTAPYALAMQSLKERVSSQDTSRFASSIDAYRQKAIYFQGGLFLRKITAPISREDSHPALFVVEHPVTVRFRGKTMCMSVKSYSPFPIQVGGNYCGNSALK